MSDDVEETAAPEELAELDLSEDERQAIEHGALTPEQIAHTRWWSEEMDRCRTKLTPILLHVQNQPDMELVKHGTSTDSSGVHEVRLTFTVQGDPYDAQ